MPFVNYTTFFLSFFHISREPFGREKQTTRTAAHLFAADIRTARTGHRLAESRAASLDASGIRARYRHGHRRLARAEATSLPRDSYLTCRESYTDKAASCLHGPQTASTDIHYLIGRDGRNWLLERATGVLEWGTATVTTNDPNTSPNDDIPLLMPADRAFRARHTGIHRTSG